MDFLRAEGSGAVRAVDEIKELTGRPSSQEGAERRSEPWRETVEAGEGQLRLW